MFLLFVQILKFIGVIVDKAMSNFQISEYTVLLQDIPFEWKDNEIYQWILSVGKRAPLNHIVIEDPSVLKLRRELKEVEEVFYQRIDESPKTLLRSPNCIYCCHDEKYYRKEI